MLFIINTLLFFNLWSASIFGETPSEAKDTFVRVEKRGVQHKFAKMGGGWVDDFTALYFKNWEEDTFDTFEMVADKDGVAIDIGGWIGTTAIWLAKNFHHVIVVEADKDSIVFLNKNLDASDCKNVTLCDQALTNANGYVFFGPRSAFSDSLNFSTSHVKEEPSSVNDFKAASINLDTFVSQYISKNDALKDHPVTFIKCDIEGGEEAILKDVLVYADAHNCRVWMSFHYDWWKEKKITDFESELAHFYAICPKGDVCEYVQKNPFASVLLIPKRKKPNDS